MSAFPSVMPARPHAGSDGRPAAAVGRHRAGVDRRAVHRIVAAQHPSAGGGGRLARSRPVHRRSPPGHGVERAYGSYQEIGRRPRRRRRLHRDPAQCALPVRAAVAAGRQAHAGREAARAERRPGRRAGRTGCGAGGLLHGGAVDDVPAEVRRHPAAAGNRRAGRDPDRASPTTASTSPTITGSCGTTWPAGRCWISAPTRSPSPPGFSASRRRSWPPASHIRPA